MIRLAQTEDMPRILEIYAAARVFMRSHGNDTQWGLTYPGEELLREDIALGRLYIIERDGLTVGCFMMAEGPDPTYVTIYDGQWGSDAPYGVIHRIAGDSSAKGILAEAVAYAKSFFRCIRIDTHEKNLPMQNALSKQGFIYRGTIYVADGTARIAYDLIS